MSDVTQRIEGSNFDSPRFAPVARSVVLISGLLVVAAVGGAAAFALARVLAFATVVTGLATAFAFAGVLAFAGVNVLLLGIIVHLAERDTGFGVCIGGMRLHGE
jgi:hypothetical protein